MTRAVIIGGSAGSLPVVLKILQGLPPRFNLPVFLCLHRLKQVRSGFLETLLVRSAIPVQEPCDKDPIKPGIAYLAPANYHMYIAPDYINLSTEPVVNHSRPAIDLSFFSAAETYEKDLVGIILSGANKDGAAGLKRVADYGGITVVQSPSESEVSVMPESALKLTEVNHILSPNQIVEFLNRLT